MYVYTYMSIYIYVYTYMSWCLRVLGNCESCMDATTMWNSLGSSRVLISMNLQAVLPIFIK